MFDKSKPVQFEADELDGLDSNNLDELLGKAKESYLRKLLHNLEYVGGGEGEEAGKVKRELERRGFKV